MTNYRQCRFRKPHETEPGVFVESVAWLPEKLAVEGKTITFKDDPKKSLWTVMSASDISQPESYVKAHERDYKTQREASDV